MTTVPAGLTDGSYTIGVTSPTGSATRNAIVVSSAGGAPTISNFTPGTVASGATVTVNGTNFETVASNNNLQVNISPVQVTSATATALQTILPPVCVDRSGFNCHADRTTVLTSTTVLANSFDLAAQTLPADGTYTVMIDPNGTAVGSVNVSITSS